MTGERVDDVLRRAQEELDRAAALIRRSEWISVAAYARVYGIDRCTVYKWLQQGGILESYKVGTLRRIRNIPPKQISESLTVEQC